MPFLNPYLFPKSNQSHDASTTLMTQFLHPVPAITTLISLTFLGLFYIYQSPIPLHFSTPHPLSSSTSIPGLSFTLTQTSTSPPTLLVTLQNNHPDTPYTLLKWG